MINNWFVSGLRGGLKFICPDAWNIVSLICQITELDCWSWLIKSGENLSPLRT